MDIKKLILVILFFLGLNALTFYIFSKDKSQKEEILYRYTIKKVDSSFKATKENYKKLIDYVVNNQINNVYVLKGLLRHDKKVEMYLFKIYKALKRYNIENMFIVSLNGKTIVGFEDNTISHRHFSYEKYSGLVMVYSLKYKNIVIGNLYISIPFSALQNDLNRIFPETYVFLIHKDIALLRLKAKDTRALIPSELSPEFYYESVHIKKLPIGYINQKIKNQVQELLGKRKPFGVVFKYDGQYILITFLPIFGAGQKFLGYLVSYAEDKTFEVIEKSFFMNIALSVALTLILIFLLIVIIRDMEKFKYLAETDRLTGLYNKGKFNEVLKKEIERAKRYKRPLSLIIFDIDHFKKINDTFGHKVGDEVLQELAKLIKSTIRKTDFAARWGGEEFVILAPETDLEGAKALAEKLRKAVENHKFPTVGKVTISLGVAQYNPDENPEKFVIRADEALYRAKEGGRNQVQISENPQEDDSK